jgi:MFS family permease
MWVAPGGGAGYSCRMTARDTVDGARPAHPVLLTLLYMPFGMPSGYVSVTLAYVLAHAGFSVEQIAGLVALQLLPQTWKFAWAPLVDTTLTARRWYLIGALGTTAGLFGTAFIPARQDALWLMGALVFISSVASTLLAMAAEVLMAHGTHQTQRGAAGGWSQAGNLGGAGLGGGLALWLSQHLAPWTGGAALGVITLLCCLALLAYREPQRESATHLHYLHSLAAVGRDVWAIARSRAGYLTLLLFILPIGTGAASGLWSALADEWQANADTVALVNGALGGVIAMVGCIIGGRLSDFMERRMAYMAYGLMLAVLTVAMGALPKTPTSFIVFTSVYAFLTGFVYAAYAAVVLDAIGRKSAATNWNLLASFANIPIWYLTLIEGHAQARWGSSGMLYTESALAVVAVIVFGVVSAATARYTRAQNKVTVS